MTDSDEHRRSVNGIVYFLLARISEDEEAARAAKRSGSATLAAAITSLKAAFGGETVPVDEAHPALISVLAARQIVREHQRHTVRNEPCAMLRLLALPYADHPDYRQEWGPGQPLDEELADAAARRRKTDTAADADLYEHPCGDACEGQCQEADR